MIDLETLGSKAGCAIVSIGACVFSSAGIGNTFYAVVDQEANVGDISPSTVKWWMQQSDEARAVFAAPDTKHIAQALTEFGAFWAENEGEFVWGHGAGFDAPILEEACSALGYRAPFKFWNSRCTRTIYDIAGVKPDRTAGTHHNALDDAVAQAHAVIKAYEILGKPL